MRQLHLTIILIFSLQSALAQALVQPEEVEIRINATPDGFEPNVISAEPGKRVTLIVTRSPASSCASNIHIPEKKIKRNLPRKKQEVAINLGVLEKGSLRFGCGKDMTEPGIIYVK